MPNYPLWLIAMFILENVAILMASPTRLVTIIK